MTDDRPDGRARPTSPRRRTPRPSTSADGLDFARSAARAAAASARQAAARKKTVDASGARTFTEVVRRAPRRPRPAAARPGDGPADRQPRLGARPQGAGRSSAAGPSSSATRSPPTARPRRSPTAGWWCAPTRPPGPPSSSCSRPPSYDVSTSELGHGTVTVIEVLGPAPAELEEGQASPAATVAVRATPTAEPGPPGLASKCRSGSLRTYGDPPTPLFGPADRPPRARRGPHFPTDPSPFPGVGASVQGP